MTATSEGWWAFTRRGASCANPIVSIDGIALSEFDFIDIGALLELSGAVPVVIKSLVFPNSAAVGTEGHLAA